MGANTGNMGTREKNILVVTAEMRLVVTFSSEVLKCVLTLS